MQRILHLLLIIFAVACQSAGEDPGLVAGHKAVENKFTISAPANGTRVSGDTLSFTLTFPYAVTVTGTPRLTLTIGAGTAYADYVSGTGTKNLVFSYTVLIGDNDSDGIAVAGSVDLNGGTLIFTGTNGLENCVTTFTAPNTSGIKIDNTAPTITSVTAPSNATYYQGMPMNFVVTYDSSVVVTGTPQLVLDVGGVTQYAAYVSGSGTSTLIFRYTVQSADADADGIAVTTTIDLNGGTIDDAVGNDGDLTFAALNTAAVLVNGAAPYVTSVTPPANGSYGLGDNLDFVLNYNEVVNVTGVPTITVTIGATPRTASYYSGTGTTQLTFRYVIQAGETDSNGITTTSVLGMTGATVRDASLTNAINGFVMPSLTSVLVIDDRPRISSFLINNGTYYIGQTFTFTALFTEAVTVTGTPRIPITINSGGPIYATYTSGSGTSNLIFSYTVVNGTDDNNGVVFVSPYELNGGSIVSTSGGVAANLTYTLPTTTNLRISGTRPTITSVTAPANGTYTTGQNLDFVVNFSENVVLGTTANIKLNFTIGAVAKQANYLSGTGTSAVTFRYTVTAPDADVDGITMGTLAVTAPAFISDLNATYNPMSSYTFTAPNTSGILVNATLPSVNSITSPANGTYLLGNNLDFVLNYSEAVTVTGTPRLTLTVGASTIYANYLSGSGTSSLTFRYTVASPQVDTDGIACSTTLDNNGGTVQSSLGMNASTTVPAQVLTAVLVDGDAPDITSVTRPLNSIYDTTDVSFNFSVTFDQVVTVAGGTPRIVLDIGGTTRYADYVSGTGSATLVFTHTINAADVDLNGISLGNSGNIDLNGATIRDANNNNAGLALGSQDLSRVIVTYPNMAAWWDVNDSSTVTTLTCGIQTCVSAIQDKTGQGYDLSAAGADQPEYVASGFGTGNTAFLNFDNSTDQMNSVTISNMRTMIIVFETESTPSATQDLFYSSAGGANARVQITTAGTGDLSYGGTATAAFSVNGAALSGAATTGNSNLGNATRYILVVRFAANQSPAATQRLGSTNFGGKITEVINFRATSLSDAQLAPIIQQLNAKHGVY